MEIRRVTGSRMIRLLVAAAVATSVGLALTPASAGLLPSACGYTQPGGSAQQQCTGQAQSTITVGTGTDVRASCSAETPWVVQATIVSCEIKGKNGDNHWSGPTVIDGQAATLVHTWQASQLSSNSYQLCVFAGYVGGTILNGGSINSPTNGVCGVTVSLPGGGSLSTVA